MDWKLDFVWGQLDHFRKKYLACELQEKNCVLKNETFIGGLARDSRDSGIL
jgi:hypothetical protein